MRILFLALVLAAGCAKKPAPQTPANKQDMKDSETKDNSKPDDKTEPMDPKKSDDPCGG